MKPQLKEPMTDNAPLFSYMQWWNLLGGAWWFRREAGKFSQEELERFRLQYKPWLDDAQAYVDAHYEERHKSKSSCLHEWLLDRGIAVAAPSMRDD